MTCDTCGGRVRARPERENIARRLRAMGSGAAIVFDRDPSTCRACVQSEFDDRRTGADLRTGAGRRAHA